MQNKKPEVNSYGERELAKAEKQLEAFQENINSLEMQRNAPVDKEEPIHKLSSKEVSNAKDLYLKPKRRIGSKEKFNERFAEEYEYDKQYVKVIAEHREIIGETIDLWSKPYPGLACEEWNVPTGKPVWIPRYVANQIKSKFYNRLKMDERTATSQDGHGTYTGQIVVDQAIQRLDCHKAPDKQVAVGNRTF